MLAKHYPELFADEPDMALKAARLRRQMPRARELPRRHRSASTAVDARYDGIATYHDSCSGLRELGVKSQPRQLLASVEGLRLVELEDSEVCCGFGGTFAVKYGEISDAIVAREERQYRRDRRRHAARRRSRLPDEHGGQAAARGPAR